MEFYYSVIIHALGPRPTPDGRPQGWQSFMTDDFTPIEFSWNWGNVEGRIEPKVRFSIEAIGNEAGTPADPWNQTATIDLVGQLKFILPYLDLQWFDNLSRRLVSDNKNDVSAKRLKLQGHRSSLFLAFEFVDRTPKMKVYTLPLVRATQTSKSVSTIISDTLSSIAQGEAALSAAHQLIKFLETGAKNLRLEPLIVAFDCVMPSSSRIKLYARSSDTNFASVEAIMATFYEPNNIKTGLGELRQLWRLTFGLDNGFCSGEKLPFKGHCTSGILYCFEVRPGHIEITPKVYLPVKHYGRNDLDIAQGLATFLRSRNTDPEQMVEHYLQFLHETCTYRSLSSACGLQTYISCSIRNGSLDITSYLSPEVYHKGRWNTGV